MSDKPNPETFAKTWDGLRLRLSEECPSLNERELDEVTDFVVAERVALRKLVVERIIGPLINRYEPGLSNEQLDTLAWVVEYHVLLDDGTVDLAYPPPGARRPGLRSV